MDSEAEYDYQGMYGWCGDYGDSRPYPNRQYMSDELDSEEEDALVGQLYHRHIAPPETSSPCRSPSPSRPGSSPAATSDDQHPQTTRPDSVTDNVEPAALPTSLEPVADEQATAGGRSSATHLSMTVANAEDHFIQRSFSLAQTTMVDDLPAKRPRLEQFDQDLLGADEQRPDSRYFIDESENQCLFCKKFGHFVHDCPHQEDFYYDRRGIKRFDTSVLRKCRRCHQTGHTARHCDGSDDRFTTDTTEPCATCQATTHEAESCPEVWRQFIYVSSDTRNDDEPTPSDVAADGLPDPLRPYCCVCGHEGHFGDDCSMRHMSGPYEPPAYLEPTSFSKFAATHRRPVRAPDLESFRNAARQTKRGQRQRLQKRQEYRARQPPAPRGRFGRGGEKEDDDGNGTHLHFVDAAQSDHDGTNTSDNFNSDYDAEAARGSSRHGNAGRGRNRGRLARDDHSAARDGADHNGGGGGRRNRQSRNYQDRDQPSTPFEFNFTKAADDFHRQRRNDHGGGHKRFNDDGTTVTDPTSASPSSRRVPPAYQFKGRAAQQNFNSQLRVNHPPQDFDRSSAAEGSTSIRGSSRRGRKGGRHRS
ncbi:hypothetical protein IWQ60_009806 [Tieghemiomyces parasiticus]|uniref:CCHC-type domain-containing protein n=1 Tax=Tieghemiomyces parasiticus TaxID=78921 RepID=A0A9W8DJA9_9FUNG|nr:hypothetical protein IWQ60_009806 [Tieghemiomyces parasiticus]